MSALNFSYAQNETQIRPASKNLCHLWSPLRVAAQMGQGLGGGALLLGQMPRGAQVGQSVIYLSLIIGLFILPDRLPLV
jgi:hypothetical protein